MPADLIAIRSAWMPSLETAAFIQYQKTQGRASSGGFLNVSGFNAGCAVAVRVIKSVSMLIERRFIECIVFVGFEVYCFTFYPQSAMTVCRVDGYLFSGAGDFYVSMWCRDFAFHPLKATEMGFDGIGFVPCGEGPDTEIIFSEEVERACPPGVAEA